jgi:ribosomal protein L37E
MMRAESFWREVRQRRNHALLVLLGWFVAGVPLWRLYSLALPTHDSAMAISAALVTWGTLWSAMSLRLTSLRCFRCGERAFDNPYFSIAEAKCKHCGVQRAASRASRSRR